LLEKNGIILKNLEKDLIQKSDISLKLT